MQIDKWAVTSTAKCFFLCICQLTCYKVIKVIGKELD